MENIFVVKIGGQVIANKKWLLPLVEAIGQLYKQGCKLVVIHGGSSQLDYWLKKLEIKIKKVNGRRITDAKTLEIAKMVYGGTVSVDLVSIFLKKLIPAVGITGVDGRLIEVIKRPTKPIDFGFVGDITKVNRHVLDDLLEKGYIPIIACLGIDEQANVYNINADTLAAKVAASVKAKKLIFVSDVAGVKGGQDSSYLKQLTIHEANEMIKKGIINNGMIPKIENAEMVIHDGVENLHIVGCLSEKKKWLEAIENNSYGTIIKL